MKPSILKTTSLFCEHLIFLYRDKSGERVAEYDSESNELIFTSECSNAEKSIINQYIDEIRSSINPT